MPRLFISYSRVDRPFVESLAEPLRRVYGSNKVWFDADLRGGQVWWPEIRAQISHCDVFLYLISPESLISSYCRMELHEARQQGKLIVPVLVRARTKVPEDLVRLHLIDMSGGITVSNLTDLQASVNQIIVDVPLPQQARITQTLEIPAHHDHALTMLQLPTAMLLAVGVAAVGVMALTWRSVSHLV